MYFKQIFLNQALKKYLESFGFKSFHSCLETNSSGIGIARGARCSICKVCSNLVHSIDWDNSNIALEYAKGGAVLPPMTITPLPVGDVTIACPSNLNGRFGPEIKSEIYNPIILQ